MSAAVNVIPEFFKKLVGVSKFDIDTTEPNDLNDFLSRQQKKRSKLLQDQIKFDEVVLDFEPTSSLPPNVRKLLWVIESRSESHFGDCRWYNAKMAETLEVSVASIERYLKILKDKNYISILTVTYSKNGKVYANRVIRCKRIWLKYQFRITDRLYPNKDRDIRKAKHKKDLIESIKKGVNKTRIPVELMSKQVPKVKDYAMKLVKEKKLDIEQVSGAQKLYDMRLNYGENLMPLKIVGLKDHAGQALMKNQERYVDKTDFASYMMDRDRKILLKYEQLEWKFKKKTITEEEYQTLLGMREEYL